MLSKISKLQYSHTKEHDLATTTKEKWSTETFHNMDELRKYHVK